MGDGLIEVLLAKVITAEIEVCTLVVRISGNEFFEDLFLLSRIPVSSGFIRLNQHPFTIRGFVGQCRCLFQVFEKLFSSW